MLADLGATVIVIRSENRKMVTPQTFSRGKYYVTLNLKDYHDYGFLIKDILPKTDILLESYRPGVMEKLGLSPS